MARKNKEEFVVLAERTVFYKTTISANTRDEAEKIANTYSENATAWEIVGAGWEVTHVLKNPRN